jgi:hypothetical protein
MKPVHEVLMYEHKGIKVAVKINYMKKEISLVEINGDSYPEIKNKLWVFADCTIPYAKAWQNIFDAMSFATKEAIKRLDEQIEKDLKAVAPKDFSKLKND